jgi:hypothetical protein
MGGTIPEKLHYSIENERVDLSNLETLNVPARSSIFLELTVTSEHSQIGWWWQTTNGDLDFYVVRCDEDKREELVWPKFRLFTTFVPEYRSVCFGYVLTYNHQFLDSTPRTGKLQALFRKHTRKIFFERCTVQNMGKLIPALLKIGLLSSNLLQ